MKKKDLVAGQVYVDHRGTKVTLLSTEAKYGAHYDYGRGLLDGQKFTLPSGEEVVVDRRSSSRLYSGGKGVAVGVKRETGQWNVFSRTLGQIKAPYDQAYIDRQQREHEAAVEAQERKREAEHQAALREERFAARLGTALGKQARPYYEYNRSSYGNISVAQQEVEVLLDRIDHLVALTEGLRTPHSGEHVALIQGTRKGSSGIVLETEPKVAVSLDGHLGIVTVPVSFIQKTDAPATVHTLPKDN